MYLASEISGLHQRDRNHLTIERIVLFFEMVLFAIGQLLSIVDTSVYRVCVEEFSAQHVACAVDWRMSCIAGL